MVEIPEKEKQFIYHYFFSPRKHPQCNLIRSQCLWSQSWSWDGQNQRSKGSSIWTDFRFFKFILGVKSWFWQLIFNFNDSDFLIWIIFSRIFRIFSIKIKNRVKMIFNHFWKKTNLSTSGSHLSFSGPIRGYIKNLTSWWCNFRIRRAPPLFRYLRFGFREVNFDNFKGSGMALKAWIRNPREIWWNFWI